MAGSPYTYDTSNMGGDLRDKDGTAVLSSMITFTQTDASVVAVMNVDSFDLPANVELRVVGPKPLAIVSWSTATIDGTLDAGSYTTVTDAGLGIDAHDRTGAAANQNCAGLAGGAGQDAATTGGSGAGGGGAHRGDGGTGGQGDTGSANKPGGSAGTAIATPAIVRGGCPGGPSGQAGNSGSVGAGLNNNVSFGGDGGGTVWIAALTSISVGGNINAGGAGGAGAHDTTANGGGGGGSGGMIGLDSVAITITGTLAANGGGGGSGACFADPGELGENGKMSASAANGGTAGGIDGASGAAGGTLSGGTQVLSDACGGGGAGGGAGFILVYRQGGTFTNTGTASPTEQVDPN
jgi:hypothetical protein